VASSYQPPASSAARQPLPHTEYLSIILGKPTAASDQIAKRNNEYNNTDTALTAEEMAIISSVAQQLSKHNFSSAYAFNAPSNLADTLPSLIKVATNWQPPANRLAALDLPRPWISMWWQRFSEAVSSTAHRFRPTPS
jgi:PUL domain